MRETLVMVGVVAGLAVSARADVRKQMSAADVARVPDAINAYKLTYVFVEGEPIGQPTYPLIAEYQMVPNLRTGKPMRGGDVELSCQPTDGPDMCDDRDQRRQKVGDIKVCYSPPDASSGMKMKGATAEWFDAGWDCNLMFKSPFFTSKARADEMRAVLRYAQEAIEKMRAIKARSLTADAMASHDDAIKRAHRW